MLKRKVWTLHLLEVALVLLNMKAEQTIRNYPQQVTAGSVIILGGNLREQRQSANIANLGKSEHLDHGLGCSLEASHAYTLPVHNEVGRDAYLCFDGFAFHRMP